MGRGCLVTMRFNRETVGGIIAIISSILLFNGIINLDVFKRYASTMPWALIIIAVALVAYRRKLIDILSGNGGKRK